MDLFEVFLWSGIFLAGLIAISGIKVVKQSDALLIERLGKYNRTLKAGFHYVIPFFERVAYKIDLRITSMDSPPQPVITADNVQIEIDAVAFFRVTDVFRASYEINDYHSAIQAIIATSLRDEIGRLDLDKTLSSREEINNTLRAALDESTDAWGIKVDRVEVRDIKPPKQIGEAMEKQMIAERTRRADVLESEGKKESKILEAQGNKESQVLNAQGQKEAQILQAEGQATEVEKLAEAKKNEIELVYGAYKKHLTEAILNYESIEAAKKAAEGTNNMVVPYESANFMGSLQSLMKGTKNVE